MLWRFADGSVPPARLTALRNDKQRGEKALQAHYLDKQVKCHQTKFAHRPVRTNESGARLNVGVRGLISGA